MLKVKELTELIASKALINGVGECSLWNDLYALANRSLLKVKQVMQNHIQLEKLICWNMGLHISTKSFKIRNLSNRIAPPNEENNSKKGEKRSVRKHIQYPNRSYTTPLNSTLAKVITTIKKRSWSIFTPYGIGSTHTHF